MIRRWGTKSLPWIGAGLTALVLSSPLTSLLATALAGSFAGGSGGAGSAPWMDFWAGTLISGLVAVGLAVFLGGGAAWLGALYTFPGKKLFSVLVVLPMALPPYLAAYAWTGLLEYSGPLSQLSQAWGGPAVHLAPQGSLVLGLLLGLQLYPYVYLTTRPALASGLAAPLEAALVLGRRGWRLFWNPGLGLLRPFLASGAAFVLMESLNEYGAAVHLGAPTLTTGLFRTWHHAYDLPGALALALQLCVLAGVLLWTERLLRRSRRFGSGDGRRHGAPFPLRRIHGAAGWGLGLVVFLPIVLGLGVPLFQLGWWAWLYPQSPGNWLGALVNTVAVSTVVAAAAVAASLAVVFFFATRTGPVRGPRTLVDVLASFGYAVPGVLGALAVVVWAGFLGMNAAVGSLALLGYALLIRYFSVGHSTLQTGFLHRSAPFGDPARVLGRSPWAIVREVHLPLLRPTIVFAFLLLILDLVKELSMTLLLRPLGFDTLPTLLYEQSSQELPQLTAIPGLILLSATVTLVLLLVKGFGPIPRRPQ